MLIKELITELEDWAHPSLQEDYDNSGLLIGESSDTIKNILVTLDVTEGVLDEAIENGCNLIIAHHPLIFKGIKRFTSKSHVDRCIIKAIKNDISIYAFHTNLDSVKNGVNFKIGQLLGLEALKILKPKAFNLFKILVNCPKDDSIVNNVLAAMWQAGAGNIGNYANCSFQMEGLGRFTPNVYANPTIGKPLQNEQLEETLIEVIAPEHQIGKILNSVKNVHPYEELSYAIIPLANSNQEVGTAMIGKLPNPIDLEDFLHLVKDTFKAEGLKYTNGLNNKISKVAFCGGSGSQFLSDAIGQKADVYLTSDFKYHDYFNADNQIVVVDIGHFDLEQFTSDLIIEHLSQKNRTFALLKSKVKTNPVNYYS